MAYSPEYIAGVVDSDGSIFIQRIVRPTGRPRYSLRVSICQHRYDDFFPWLEERFGGKYSGYETRSVPEWVLCGIKSLEFLQWLTPHLHIKKPQAELAIEFCSTIRPGGHREADFVSGVQQPIFEQIHSLNRRHKEVCHREKEDV